MLYILPLPISFPLLLLATEQRKNKLEHKFQLQKKNIILTCSLSNKIKKANICLQTFVFTCETHPTSTHSTIKETPLSPPSSLSTSSTPPPSPPSPLHPKLFRCPPCQISLKRNSYGQSFFLLNVLPHLCDHPKILMHVTPSDSLLDKFDYAMLNHRFRSPLRHLNLRFYPSIFLVRPFFLFCFVHGLLYGLVMTIVPEDIHFFFFMNIRFSFLFRFN